MNKLVNLGLGIFVASAVGLASLAIADGGETSITGNLRDSYCYGTMGAHGAGHKACAIKCASAGIPVTLIESGTDKAYILLPNKDASPLPQSVIQHMEDKVTVTGKEYSKNGLQYLVVESVK